MRRSFTLVVKTIFVFLYFHPNVIEDTAKLQSSSWYHFLFLHLSKHGDCMEIGGGPKRLSSFSSQFHQINQSFINQHSNTTNFCSFLICHVLLVNNSIYSSSSWLFIECKMNEWCIEEDTPHFQSISLLSQNHELASIHLLILVSQILQNNKRRKWAQERESSMRVNERPRGVQLTLKVLLNHQHLHPSSF